MSDGDLAPAEGLDGDVDAPPGPGRLPPVPWTLPESFAVFAVAFVGAIALTAVASVVVSPAYAVPASLLAFNGAVITTTVGFVALRYPRHVGRLFGSRRPRPADVGVGLGIGLGAYAVINIGLVLVFTALASALGLELPETQQSLRDGVADPATAPWVVASAVVLAPFAEELFFRGMLFQAGAKRLGVAGAVALSAVAFGLAHVQATLPATAIVFVAILPLGAVLAWSFWRRGSLLVPVLVHAVFNAVSSIGLLALE